MFFFVFFLFFAQNCEMRNIVFILPVNFFRLLLVHPYTSWDLECCKCVSTYAQNVLNVKTFYFLKFFVTTNFLTVFSKSLIFFLFLQLFQQIQNYKCVCYCTLATREFRAWIRFHFSCVSTNTLNKKQNLRAAEQKFTYFDTRIFEKWTWVKSNLLRWLSQMYLKV